MNKWTDVQLLEQSLEVSGARFSHSHVHFRVACTADGSLVKGVDTGELGRFHKWSLHHSPWSNWMTCFRSPVMGVLQ